jgi:hypothetical protein
MFAATTVVPCIAGEVGMDQGRNAAHIEFVNLNCGDWVEADQTKLISFGERLKQVSDGLAVSDAVWAYRITTEINMKHLKEDPGGKKILCTTRVLLLTDAMKDAAPFKIKKEK